MYIATNPHPASINLFLCLNLLKACLLSTYTICCSEYFTRYKSKYFIMNPYRLCGESIRPCFSYQSRGISQLANRSPLRHFIDEDSLIVRYKTLRGTEGRENKIR